MTDFELKEAVCKKKSNDCNDGIDADNLILNKVNIPVNDDANLGIQYLPKMSKIKRSCFQQEQLNHTVF